MAVYEWTFPEGSDATPCPGLSTPCGGLTDDEAGGPCTRCWDSLGNEPEKGWW